jgi:hypothetical protein
VRANVGRDFGSWAVGFSEFPYQPDGDKCSSSSSSGGGGGGGDDCDVVVLLANDSVFGPFFSLSSALHQFFSSGSDLFGLTESLEVRCTRAHDVRALYLLFASLAQGGRHLQSYFLFVSFKLWCPNCMMQKLSYRHSPPPSASPQDIRRLAHILVRHRGIINTTSLAAIAPAFRACARALFL